MMEKIASLEQYRRLIQSVKDRFEKISTNGYMFRETVERYIRLGRFYYETAGQGIMLYSDEEAYYRGYYFLPCEEGFSVAAKEKPVVLRILYRDGKRDEKAAERLETAGFRRRDTLLHMSLDADAALRKYEKVAERTLKFLAQEGFLIGRVKEGQLEDILAFSKTIEEIPFYQFSYMTEEEYREALEKGMLYCVTDKEGAVCAAEQFMEEGNALYGWAGVGDRYRGIYGMIIPLSRYRWEFAKAHGKKVMGWVNETNIPSIEYHNRQGWTLTGKKADEWILQRPH